MLWGEVDKAGGNTLDVRAHAEALVDLKGLVQVLDTLDGVAVGEVVGDAFERQCLFGGHVKLAVHVQGLPVERKGAGALAGGGDCRGRQRASDSRGQEVSAMLRGVHWG